MLSLPVKTVYGYYSDVPEPALRDAIHTQIETHAMKLPLLLYLKTSKLYWTWFFNDGCSREPTHQRPPICYMCRMEPLYTRLDTSLPNPSSYTRCSIHCLKFSVPFLGSCPTGDGTIREDTIWASLSSQWQKDGRWRKWITASQGSMPWNKELPEQITGNKKEWSHLDQEVADIETELVKKDKGLSFALEKMENRSENDEEVLPNFMLWRHTSFTWQRHSRAEWQIWICSWLMSVSCPGGSYSWGH